MEESKWHELPDEIVELIFKKLASIDILRFEAVCSSWRLAAKCYVASSYYHPLPQAPWLLLRNDQDDNKSCRFFSVEEKRVYTIPNVFEGLHDDSCVGSSYGWLVIMDKKAALYLLNPISRATIELPHIQTLPDFSINFSSDHISKTIVSSDPSRSNSFVVAVLTTQPSKSRLGFYKHEDKTWKSLDGAHIRGYKDIIFHHEQLYALRSNGEVDLWDLRKPLPLKTTYLLNPMRIEGYATCLVQSLGDILQVRRTYQRKLYDRSYITTDFLVYRMNLTTAKWEKVQCLGGRNLFCGRHGSVKSAASHFKNLDENSIYYYNSDSHSVGVYCLTTKNVKPFHEFEKWRTDGSREPFWIVPDLCVSNNS